MNNTNRVINYNNTSPEAAMFAGLGLPLHQSTTTGVFDYQRTSSQGIFNFLFEMAKNSAHKVIQLLIVKEANKKEAQGQMNTCKCCAEVS